MMVNSLSFILRETKKNCFIIRKELLRYNHCELQVNPKWSLMDEEVTIKGSSLPENSEVTLVTSLKDNEQRIDLKSECHYTIDGGGGFNSAHHPPCPGSGYEGVHPSGPLWSVRPQKGSLVRLWPHNIMKPLNYNFVLKDKMTGEVLATENITKSFVSPAVQRVTVRVGRIRGTLFLPPRPGPAIITLYGGVNKGKVPEDRYGGFHFVGNFPGTLYFQFL